MASKQLDYETLAKACPTKTKKQIYWIISQFKKGEREVPSQVTKIINDSSRYWTEKETKLFVKGLK
jgi:hypothetical protein